MGEVNFKSRKIISCGGTSAAKTLASNAAKPSLIAAIISATATSLVAPPPRVITVAFSQTFENELNLGPVHVRFRARSYVPFVRTNLFNHTQLPNQFHMRVIYRYNFLRPRVPARFPAKTVVGFSLDVYLEWRLFRRKYILG